MELTKSQERRLSFVASLLSLNPNDPTDRIKALRHLNLDEEGCFHGFQYSQGNLEFFIFLDESTPLERVVTNLTQDLKQLRVALCRTSEPKNPFFASLSEEADPWDVVKINAAKIRRRRKAAHISHNAAAHGNDAIGAGKIVLHQSVQKGHPGMDVLALLPLREGDDHGRLRLRRHGLGVCGGDSRIGDDKHLATEVQQFPRTGKTARFNDHVVTAFPKIYG